MTGEKGDSAVLPATLAWAVRLLLGQAAALAALTAYLVVMLVTDAATSVTIAIGLVVLAVLGVAFIVVVARSLARRGAGARGPAIVVQLMVIASGGFLVQTSPVWLGLVLMVLGVIVGVLIVLPASTRALGVD